MASFAVYKINDDWEVEVVLYWDCCYVLNDGTLLPTQQMESWCRNCRNVVAGEVVPTIVQIDEEIRQLTDPNDKIHKCFGRATIEKMLADARLRLRWRPTRESGPRCLECQSSDIVHITDDSFVDPVSGTNIRQLSGGHASMAVEVMRRLTPEGLLLETTQ